MYFYKQVERNESIYMTTKNKFRTYQYNKEYVEAYNKKFNNTSFRMQIPESTKDIYVEAYKKRNMDSLSEYIRFLIEEDLMHNEKELYEKLIKDKERIKSLKGIRKPGEKNKKRTSANDELPPTD